MTARNNFNDLQFFGQKVKCGFKSAITKSSYSSSALGIQVKALGLTGLQRKCNLTLSCNLIQNTQFCNCIIIVVKLN